MSAGQHEYEERSSKEAVEARIRTMTPADALVAVTQFNGEHLSDPSKHIDPTICLQGLSSAEAEDVMARVRALYESATSWGARYWVERMRAGGHGPSAKADEQIMAEMAKCHPGFSLASLSDIYGLGLMLAR